MSALPLVSPASTAVLDRDQLRALLQDQQFAEVERLLDEVQDAHHRGELNDRELWCCYSVAHCFRADLTGAFERWRLERPSSPQGMLCRALHASGRYFSLRTYRLAKDIPAEHQAGMRQQYELADRLSQQLTQTHPELLVVWWLRLQLAMCQGQQNWSDYRQGLTHHPHSLRLRQAMLSALRTEWGGTDAAQLAFLERPEHA